MTDATLRPLLPGDVPALIVLFQASVAVLAEDDYSEAQREAWSARADDEAAFGKALAAQLTLVATRGGTPVGFASLKGPDHVEMLYVDPREARTGVATLLLDALEKIAGARGATVLTVDASDTARDFFMARGFTPLVRKTAVLGEQWLGTTGMEKTLTSGPQA